MAYAADETDDKKRRKPKPPDDFDSEQAFLDAMRQDFDADLQADILNAKSGTEDLEFMVADQWDKATRTRRDRAKKPTLTINRIPAFVAQVVGQRRMNETTIKVIPDNDGQEPAARIREGLMRSIQKTSRADVAYDKALENQVICGIGNFQVELDYAGDDVFEQEIKICSIPNAFAVVWDRMLTDPTGADACHVFVTDRVPNKLFEQRYPGAQPGDISFDSATRPYMDGWFGDDMTRVVSYWRMRVHKRTLALMQDGKTVDITDDERPETLANIMQRDDGTPIMREVDRKYAQMYVCSGSDILEGPYSLPISRVPVLRVPGWEVMVGDRKHRWGLVRFMKDPQRLHNFWRSVVAEKLMQTPRAKWLASKQAVQGEEKKYRESHLSDDPLLLWDGESASKPEMMPPAQMEQALLAQSEMSTQDLKDVSNIHEANLGMPSNEVSGAAIMARQRVSDTGTVLYHDNLNQAIEQAGIIINDLIPTTYDTPRTIKVLGADAKTDLVKINDPNDPATDITAGKYSVSVVTGPNTATKRIESLAFMTSLANSIPQSVATFLDLYVEAMDAPLADKIAARIRMTMPPGIVDPKDMTPEMQQRAAGMAQQQQQAQQFQQATAAAELQKTQSEAALNFSRAKNFSEEAGAQQQRINTESFDAASRAQDRELRGRLEAVKVASGV